MPSRGRLGDLLAGKGLTVNDPASAPPPPAEPAAEDGPDLRACGKLVLRRERRGRGGKTATVLSGLRLSERDLDRLARTLRRALGCGTHVQDDTIVLHGDLSDRTQAWLTTHGATKVILGN